MTKIIDILTSVRDSIKTAYPFFSVGYAYARLDDKLGLAATIEKDMKYVGIQDTKGDYFYIRVADKLNSVPFKALADCNKAIAQTLPCVLVAVVKKADELLLVDALTNELLKTKGGVFYTKVNAQYINPAAILDLEFKGLKEDVIKSAKSRLKDLTVVRIDFDIIRHFETTNCAIEVCKNNCN